MFGFFLRWSVNLLALVIAGSLIPGIRIQSIQMGMIAAAILGVVNAVIRPLVLILTLPINLLTLGLFTLVINAAMLKLVADVVPGFVIESFRAAFLGALLISLISWVLNIFIGGDGTFVSAGERLAPYFQQKSLGRGLAAGDLDDDGDLDLVVLENDGPVRVLENVLATQNHWIAFKLIGTRSPRDAIGARVVVACGDQRQVQQVIGSSSYFSWQDLRLFFGINARTDAASAEIRWPSGQVQKLEKLALDSCHTVTEPQ